jgi:CelD/BcsL family acetyltransferase involved in cellulose biosynthesis
MNHWAILPLQRSLGAHARTWDALNESGFGNHPMLTSLFVDGLLQCFGTGTEHLCVLEEHGRVQAMCVLTRKNTFLWTSFLPSQAQIGLTMIDDATLLPGLLRSLPGYVIRLDLLCNDPLVGGLASSTRSAAGRFNHSLTIQISLTETFDKYWASRSKNLQANFKRYVKQLTTDGFEQRHVQITQPEQIAAAVDRYAAIEGSGWKGRIGTALGSKPTQLRFYQQLMLGFARHGDAVVHELWFGEKLVASRLVIRRHQMVTILKTTYDESMAAYAPGRLQLRAVIEDAFVTSPGGQLEFYTDATLDQLGWATGSRWIPHVTLYRTQAAVLLMAAARALRTRHATPVADLEDKEGIAIEMYHDPDELPPQAQKLMNHTEQMSVELGMAWFRNLILTVYPSDPGVHFFVLRQGQQVRAVLPLRVAKRGLGWQLHSLSNYYTALYSPAMVPNLKPEEMANLLALVRMKFPRASSFRLAPMNPDSHAYQTLLSALQLQGWMPFEFFAFGNWYLPVRDSWQDYLSNRDGMLRSTLKRRSKKFSNVGGTLQLVSKASDMPAAISAYEQVYAKSWKTPEPFVDFSSGLLKMCASQGWLRLGMAWIAGKPIAAQLWIVANGRAEIYKVAYDEGFKTYSPGTLVTAMLMQHVQEVDKVHEVDYLIGDDAYKKAWMTHRRERWGIVAYNPRTLGGLGGVLSEMVGRWGKPWARRIQAFYEKIGTWLFKF